MADHPMNAVNRGVYISDNLPFLQSLNDECIDLVCIDPPFAKNETFGRKNSKAPAFAIGPTAVEEKPKADCRTRKGNKQRNQGPAEALVAFTKTRIQFRNFLYPRNATGAAGRNINPGQSALAFQPSRKAENRYRKRLFK